MIKSDFIVVILSKKIQQFSFFIVEFEQNRLEIHKDHAVVVSKMVFEMNYIFAMVQNLDNVFELVIHVGLINNMLITFGEI